MKEIIDIVGMEFIIVLLTATATVISLFANPVIIKMDLDALSQEGKP